MAPPRKTTEQCIIDFDNKHGKGTYDYSLFVNNGAHTKSIIICPIHNKQFLMSPTSHLAGQGCPDCGREVSRLLNTKSTEQFIIEANIKHGKGTYDYRLFCYIGVHEKGIIICPIHNKQFLMRPNSHLIGQGCPDCAGNVKKSTEQFIIDANIKHGKGRYDYSLVNYINGTTKVIIICPIHQKQFLMTPSVHLRGQGCPECGRESSNESRTKSTEEYIIDFENKHGKGRYDYSLFANNGSATKSIIICPIHQKQFLMTPNNHLTGNGCPLCKESKGEKAIRLWLTENNIKFDTQYKPIKDNTRLAFDFWLPDYQLLIEFDGMQHYRPVKRFGGQKTFDQGQVRDKQKTQWCIINNIELMRIKYTEIKKIPLILSQKLINSENLV